MGRRGTPHQPDNGKGELVPFDQLGGSLDSPLLPFEKELIRILGCTEEEYRHYTKEVQLKSKARPAEYELIPDVRNDALTIAIISLVLGVASTAASLLLQPKPKAPREQRQGKSIRLASRQGAERFGTTSGFDTIADLANYAEPIAVIFAKRENNIGGVLATPQLVWSRAFSYGNEQAIKLMFILGEQGIGGGIERPDLAGIFLGTSALDAVYANKFAFYWNRNTNVNGRIKAKNFAYGTRATQDAGDPQINDDIFLCPSGSAVNDQAFSQSWTPSSNTSFGCYGAVANGTGYRVNFELVPLPKQEGEDREDRAKRLSSSIRKREKISGLWGRDRDDIIEITRLGQTGMGREYGRHMGVQLLNGVVQASGGPGEHKKRVSVKVGDRITFGINGKVVNEAVYWTNKEEDDVNIDDVNNATIRFREEADDMLQVGQIVMIARTVWVVKGRALERWGEGIIGPFNERPTQGIELECIEIFADGAPGNQIGFVSPLLVFRNRYTDDQGQEDYEYKDPVDKGLTCGPGFYPLMRVSFGLVRNTRPCDVTEFGIKSQVWNQANGLCNFGPLPKPKGLRQADKRGDSITSGTMNTYFARTSVFTIFLRPAGVQPGTDEEYRWRPLGEQFAVRGNRPVDQYNYIRLFHYRRGEYEFKFVPKNGADLTQHTPDDAEFLLLDASLADYKFQGAIITQNCSTEYGNFTLQVSGKRVTKGQIEFAPEMATGVESNTEKYETINAPSDVFIKEYLPDIDPPGATATACNFLGWTGVPESAPYKQAAFFAERLGQAKPYGATRSTTFRVNNIRPESDGGSPRWIELQVTGTVNAYFPSNHPYFPGWRAWQIVGAPKVVRSSPGFNISEIFNCRVPISPGNPRNPGGLSSAGVKIQISATTAATGGPRGRQNGYSYEVLGDAERLSVGTRRTARLFLESGDKSVTIEYSAQVVTAPQGLRDTFGVSKAFDYEQVLVVPNSSSGDWAQGEQITDTYLLSASNPYAEIIDGDTVGVRYQVRATRQEIGISVNGDRVFEENAGITDMSMYSERTTSNASNPEHEIVYVSESIKNEDTVNYDKLTSCGLAMRSGREFNQVDQLRTWLYSGIEVTRFHPSEAGTIGPSNLLPDLVYYLMTDTTAGVGELISRDLIDLDSFAKACTFLRTNQLFFNGAITEPQNLRDYITEIAPFFLLDFAILGGKFSFSPAIPTDSAGNISLGAVPISALFTEGNIIEDSFSVEYLEADQRRDFIAVMRWRDEQINKFPEEKTIAIRWNEAGSNNYPIESFDMTDYCCDEQHAVKAAKYLLSIRRRITHTVTFQTTPEGLNLAPGQYIKVVTQASPYQAQDNGIIEADGTLVASRDLDDAVYPIYYYDWDSTEITEGAMTVVNGKVQEENLWDTIFTMRYPGISAMIYQVQQLTLDEDGLVEVVALEHPTDGSGVSMIARDLIQGSDNFRRGY